MGKKKVFTLRVFNFLFIFFSVGIVVIRPPSFANMGSQSFVVPTSVCSSGGLLSNSDSFDMLTTIGQSTPVGEQNSTSYTTYSGYWYTTEADISFDVCEGNFDCDQDCDGSDAAEFKSDFGRSNFLNPCTNEDQCHGDFDCDVDVDGTDASVFKSDFGRSPFLNPCPVCEVGDWCSY